MPLQQPEPDSGASLWQTVKRAAQDFNKTGKLGKTCLGHALRAGSCRLRSEDV